MKKEQKLPKFFDGEIYEEGGTVKNRITGEEYELNNIELSMYHLVMGSYEMLEWGCHGDDDARIKMNVIGSGTGSTTYSVRKICYLCIDWFKENNEEAYNILLYEVWEDLYLSEKTIDKRQEEVWTDSEKDEKQRVNFDEMEDIGIFTHYKGKPFTGIAYNLHENGNLHEETEMLNGLKHGYGKCYHENGQILLSGNYKDDEMDGLWISSGGEGIKEELNFKNGFQEGKQKTFLLDVLYSEADFKKDKLNGFFKKYSKDGVVKMKAKYKEGKCLDIQIYDSYGKEIQSFKFKKDMDPYKHRKKAHIVELSQRQGKLKDDFTIDFYGEIISK